MDIIAIFGIIAIAVALASDLFHHQQPSQVIVIQSEPVERGSAGCCLILVIGLVLLVLLVSGGA